LKFAHKSQLGSTNKLPIKFQNNIYLLLYGTKHDFIWISFHVPEV